MTKLILFLLFSITVQQHCSAESPNYGNVAIFLDDSEKVRLLDSIKIPAIAGKAAVNIACSPEHYAFILSANVFMNVVELANIEHEKTGKMFLLDSLRRYKIFVSADRRFFILASASYEKTMLQFIDESKIEVTDFSLVTEYFEAYKEWYYVEELIALWRKDAIPLNIYLDGHGM